MFKDLFQLEGKYVRLSETGEGQLKIELKAKSFPTSSLLQVDDELHDIISTAIKKLGIKDRIIINKRQDDEVPFDDSNDDEEDEYGQDDDMDANIPF